METNNYTRELIVTNTTSATYKALTHEFDKWWTPGSKPVENEGDTVTFRFGTTYWTMRITRLVQDNIVEFECIEANHHHKGLPDSILKEWLGTRLKWKIEAQGDKTKISFVHEGLVPDLNCWDICETGWDHYFLNSLAGYLNTGKGMPG